MIFVFIIRLQFHHKRVCSIFAHPLHLPTKGRVITRESATGVPFLPSTPTMLTILSALFSSTKYHGRICGRNPNYRSTTPGPLSCVSGHRIRPPFATLHVATHNDEKDPFLAVSLSSPLVPPRLSTNSNMLTSRRLQELLRRSLLRQPRPLANDRLASSVDVPGSGCKTLHGQRFYQAALLPVHQGHARGPN